MKGGRVQFITNGSLLRPKLAQKLAERSGYDLQLSLDAFSKRTYNSIRVGADFDDVIKKFTYFVDCLRETKSDVNLSITSVLMRRSIEELPMIIRFAARLGIPLVTGNNMVMTGNAINEPEESLVFHPTLFNRVRNQCLGLADETGVTVNLPEPFPLTKEELSPNNASRKKANYWDICHEPWTRLDMRSGAFCFCCGGHPGVPFNKAFVEHPSAEPFSLKYMTGFNTIYDLFNSNVLRTLRKRLLTDRPPKYCKNCVQKSNTLHGYNFHTAFNKDIIPHDAYNAARSRFIKKFHGTEYLTIMLKDQ
jgi:MoaA/NifB/PqqE/SkfB family radical SAM enzyme